jgi:8-oxo-dGTP pyrophosphatase MutT (NUDIX family)
VSVKPPVVPVAAATLVLLRDGPSGAELLLIKRHGKSKFAAGDHVFPGGKVETHDNPADAATWCTNLDVDAAATRLGLPPAETVAHLVGVIRETFEEVGILLAYDEHGRPSDVTAPGFVDHRARCQHSNAAFWDMVVSENLTLATERIVYFAHWITPEEQPLRFDTRFFAAETLPGQAAVADGREITEVRWLGPDAALEAAKAGEISLRNPTVRNIELFRGGTSAADAVRRVTGREIPTIRPRVLMENGQRRVLMPGEPGWY